VKEGKRRKPTRKRSIACKQKQVETEQLKSSITVSEPTTGRERRKKKENNKEKVNCM
jgi:hypothetical protein